MTDQESAMLPGPANLPNRRRLEPHAVRFRNAFCNTPQCSAARSSLLTGLEPHATHVLTNVDGGSLGKALSPSIPTIGSVFQKAGYATGYFGKWHLGNEAKGLAEFGFSHFEAGQDEAVSRQAAEWIRKQSGPWLCWVSILNPHHIYSIPQLVAETKPRAGVSAPISGLANLAGKPDEQRAYVDKDQGKQTKDFTPEQWIRYRSYYVELVEKADACFGTVLDTVKDWNSTVVAYTSDHGDALGEHGLPYKGPFMYDELIRIPMYIAAPGMADAGKTRDDMVTSADLSPTLAALAGLTWPSRITGLDLTRNRNTRDAVFLEYYAKQKWVNPIRTIRTRNRKLNWYDSGHQELYDLEHDPHELKNLAGQGLPIQKELEARLDHWRGPLTKR